MMRFLLLLLLAMPFPAHAENLRIAVTTSFQNSGLADYLLPQIARDTGIDVALVVVGTGQALKLAERGDVDGVIVHAPGAEAAFVAAGHAPYRREFMFNDFVLLGAGSDDAYLSLDAALRDIHEQELPFLSRGDDSGTHKKELTLWQDAGFSPDDFGPWYREAGAGMGASLNIAVAMGAVILSDRASWLNFANQGDHGIIFEGGEALHNVYSFLPAAESRKRDALQEFENWLAGPKGQTLIAAYRIAGQQVFYPSAKPR